MVVSWSGLWRKRDQFGLCLGYWAHGIVYFGKDLGLKLVNGLVGLWNLYLGPNSIHHSERETETQENQNLQATVGEGDPSSGAGPAELIRAVADERLR